MAEVRREPDPTVSDRSVADLVKQLSDQTATLVRQEIDLAKAELTEKGKRAGLGAGMFGAAAVFGVFGLGALTACAILVLNLVMAGWLAALIVFVAWIAIAGVLALMGKNQLAQGVPPVPQRAVESTKEDVEWTKQRAKAGRG